MNKGEMAVKIEKQQGKIDELQAENKELQTRNDRQADEITKLWGLTKRNEMLQGKNERLKEALEEYGQHKTKCATAEYPEAFHCICGFAQALQEKPK